MADVIVPPLPPKGEIVSQQALYNTQITLYRNSLGFGGMRNPTMIWDAMLRNDGNAIPMYRELEEKDEDVSNALDTLKMQAHGRPHSVTPFDETPQAAEVADFIRAQLCQVPDFDLIMDNTMDAVGYGFSIGEMVFDTSMGQASLLDIKDCPQELFLFGERFQPQIGPLQFLDQPWASSGMPVPEGKFLINSYRPRGRNRMGRPLLRSVFWPSWFKRNVQRLWMLYAEKGPGTVVVRYPDSDDATGQQLAAEIAQAIRDGVALGVPMNFEYDKELLTSTRPMDPAVYEHFFEALQLSIVRKILGETLTSFGGEKGKGTQALGEVHSDMLEKKAISLCRATAGIFNAQVVRPLVLWNFGPDAPMPKWGYEIGQAEDLDKAINRDQTLQTMGLPMTEDYLYKKYWVPQPGPNDVLCTRAQAPAVAVPDAEDVTFAERTQIRASRLRNQQVAEAQLAQFDGVLAGLQDEATKLLAKRMVEIVDAVAPGGR
jgi:phage gp29-like protein